MKLNGLCAVLMAASMLAACSGPLYNVDRSPTLTIPDPDAATGERTAQPDEVILSAPVGFAQAALLQDDTLVELIGKSYGFSKDDTLPIARIFGQAAANLPPNAIAFCGKPDANVAKRLMAASTLGISQLLNRTSLQTQVCFLDPERDDSAESAILVGAKTEEDAAPVAIEPLAYSVVAGEPMSGESEMRIIYRGKTGLVGGHVSFDLEVIEQGEKLVFENVRRKVDIADLPKEVTLMGSIFTVQSYDPETGAVVIDVQRAIPLTMYGLRTVYRTQTIPIYVPR